MGQIHKLSDNVINLIAAGEVVERPASVIKELVENSLDAGATQIKIEINTGGTELITVSDNGKGIAADDIELAFTQHATSKLSSINDLQKLFTLGFRGEALASIASVSEIEIESSHNGEQVSATLLNGKISKQQASPAGSTLGTRIAVKNLFHNIPARQKFLKSATTESKQAQNLFTQLALANPQVHLELYKDGKLYKRLPRGTITDRIYELFGSEVSTQLYEFVNEQPHIKISGLLGNPMTARADTTMQFLFLNKRPISDKTVQSAISQGYRGFLHKDLRPIYFINIEIDPAEVDVNVHPRKQEVKFSNSQEIFRLTYQTVVDTLSKASKSEILQRVGTQTQHMQTPEISPQQSTKSTRNIPSQTSYTGPRSFAEKSTVSQAMDFTSQVMQSAQILTDVQPLNSYFGPGQTPQLGKLLQIFNTYIVYETENAVVFVDQHAAAEKITYEKLLSQHQGGIVSKPMLIPLILEFSKTDATALLEVADQLKTIGIDISGMGGTTIQVNELPEVMDTEQNIKQMLIEILGALADEKSLQNDVVLHDILASLACHGSIRAGQKLDESEMRQILQGLAACDNPYNCPHGRPVSWEIAKPEVEKHFKRII
jgi:DNA mismatch repair protein MutL